MSPRGDAPSPFGARASLAERVPHKQILDGGLTPDLTGRGFGLVFVYGAAVWVLAVQRDATSKPRLAVTGAPNRAPARRGTVDVGAEFVVDRLRQR